MQNPRTLLKNTRASLRFHKRLIMFLVALLAVILGVVALSSALYATDMTVAGNSSATNSTNDGTSVSWGTGGSTQGSISVFTTTDPTPTPTATPTDTPDPTPTPSTTSTATPTPSQPPFVTPEYSLGGGLVAIFAGFVAFTLFMRKTKTRKQA